jgi:hypothetical protein
VVRSVSTDVSEEHISSIFRVEEINSANQRASRWQAEDDTFHNHRCENLKSNMLEMVIFIGSNPRIHSKHELNNLVSRECEGVAIMSSCDHEFAVRKQKASNDMSRRGHCWDTL